MVWVIFIISLVVAFFIVNAVQNLYMKLIGAEFMFFDGKKKLIAILVVALVIGGAVAKLFGLT